MKKGVAGCVSKEEVVVGHILSNEYQTKYLEVGEIETRIVHFGKNRSMSDGSKKLVARTKRSINYGVTKKINDEGLIGSEATCPSAINGVLVVNEPNPSIIPMGDCCK